MILDPLLRTHFLSLESFRSFFLPLVFSNFCMMFGSVFLESGKWKCKSLSRVQLFATPWTDYTVHGILQVRILEWVAFAFYRGSFQPRDGSQVSHIVGGFFTSWAARKAQEWVGRLSLLQRIFPIQESIWGLLHYKLNLYQLSYQGSQ